MAHNSNDTIYDQRIHSIEIKSLKNLIDLKISFEENPMTAILGVNGHGKSTILHALACAFQPIDSNAKSYKFSQFFHPNPHAKWDGSKMQIEFSFKRGKDHHNGLIKTYEKTSERWTRYGSRPKRNVIYMGVDVFTPVIEVEKKRGATITYDTKSIEGNEIQNILDKASYIFNKKYEAYYTHSHQRKSFVGVKVNGLTYSALTMSAGEQKVFYILDKVVRAGKCSLILIDEFDFLLHDIAIDRLVEVIHEIATKNKHQVVFTTHRESILNLSTKINIRHIFCKGEKSFCFNETKPDAITRLTGKQLKPLEVFVEDDLASTIVENIAEKLQLRKYIDIICFGSATNALTMAAALLLRENKKIEHGIFILDGDVIRTEDEKRKLLNKVLSGDRQEDQQRRDLALSMISQFTIPEGLSPEEYIHSAIIKLKSDSEIISLAKEIHSVNDKHNYLNEIIEKMGWDKRKGLSKIIDVMAQTGEWEEYTKPIYEYLSRQSERIKETKS